MDKSIFLWEYLQETRKPIVIYGMGDGCDKIMAVCRKKGIPIQGVFASDGFVREKKVHGFPLRDYRSTKEAFGDMIVLLAFGVFRPEDLALIQKMDRETQFFAPEVPLFGGELFDRAYWNQHREELDRVEDMLTDPLSRKTFRSIWNTRSAGGSGRFFPASRTAPTPLKSWFRSVGETFLRILALTTVIPPWNGIDFTPITVAF